MLLEILLLSGAQNIMADRRTNYRTVLADVADELTDEEAKALAIELDVSRGERGKIINGRTLIDVMEKNGLISGNNVDQLLRILKNRRHNVAATKLEDYKKNNITSPESESGDMLLKDKRVEESYLEEGDVTLLRGRMPQVFGWFGFCLEAIGFPRWRTYYSI
ncbi:uncharacterized protein [Apostichopus japonicus]|uniref:uncharacterized protein isoform X2 n=1 Tax=Stichopus japonicus TaxID=307972 RepID=UPI003AB296F5